MDLQKERLIAIIDENEAIQGFVFNIYNPPVIDMIEHPIDWGEKPRKPRHCEREIGVRTEPKTGRNDPCPCGSSKKHKHCCLGKPAPQPMDM